MADVITIDVDEKPAVDGFENLIAEIIKTDKATDRLEASGNKAVSTINRVKPAAAQSSAALGQMGERVSQLGVQFSTGNEKLAGFVPNLLRMGPAGAVAVGAVAGLAGVLSVLNNTGLRDGNSNLDRMGKAFGNLAGTIAPNINLLKTADNTITGISDTIVANTEVLTENTRQWVLWLKGIQDTKGVDNFFARTQAGFEAIREEEKRVAEETIKQSKEKEIAALKEIQEVKERLAWLREEQANIIFFNKNQDERNKKLQESFAQQRALKAQLVEIEKKAAEQIAIGAKAGADLRIAEEKRVADSFKASQDRQTQAFLDGVEQRKRIAKDFADFQRGAAADRRGAALSDAEAILRARNEEEKALAERLTGKAKDAAISRSNAALEDSLHVLAVKRIREETAERLAGTKVADIEEQLRIHRSKERDVSFNSEMLRAHREREEGLKKQLVDAQAEAAKITYEGTRKLATAEADFKRQQLLRQIQDRTEAARKQIELEKQKKEAFDNLLKGDGAAGGAGGPQFDAKAILQAQTPAQIRKQLQQRAFDEAKAKFNRDNAEERTAADGDSEKRRAFERRADRAGDIGWNKATKDFAADQRERALRSRMTPEQITKRDAADPNRFNIDPSRIAQAQVDAANKTAQTLVGKGALDKNVAQALGNQLQIAAKAQLQIDQTAAQVKQILDAQQTLQNAQNPQKTRASAGGQKG